MIEKINKWLPMVNTIAILAIVLVLVGGNNQSVNLGGGSRFPNGISADSTSPSAGQIRGTTSLVTTSAQVSSSGTAITRINTGTCYFNPTATTITASTTVDIDCQATAAVGNPNSLLAAALTGVTSGDNVVVMLSSSTAAFNGTTATSGGGLIVVGASASTTSGYIRLRLFNAMGTTYTYPVQAVGGVTASGTASYIVTK